MTVVKICGLTRPCDIESVNSLRPEMAGFVLHKPSRRYAGETIHQLSGMLDPGIVPVGVFVDSPAEDILELVESGAIGAVQLHGSEDERFIRGLRRETDVPIIRAFIVGPGTDLEQIEGTDADLVLLDAGMGSGTRFDWSLIADVGRDFVLSGGLSPENVADAIRTVRPYGVDVSSGVESKGFKDPEKMASFIGKVRMGDGEP